MKFTRIVELAIFIGLIFLVTSPGLSVAMQHPIFDKSKLDPISSACSSCHNSPFDDPKIKDTNDCCFLPFKGKENKLIISTSYSELSKRNVGLRPAEMLPDEIVLYDGEITCTTCHGNDSHNGKKTVLDHGGSILCYGCHLEKVPIVSHKYP